MIRILLCCLVLTACGGSRTSAPVVTQVTWSHAAPPADDWSELAKIQTRTEGSETVASVWGTTYIYQDLNRAKGWLQRENDSYVLCFYAPEDKYGSGDAIPSVAWPTHFTYRIQGLPRQTRLEFREKCAPRA